MQRPLPPAEEQMLTGVVAALRQTLFENLHSVVLYGSAARGEYVVGASDLNVLIVLVESTPEAHAAIADALRRKPLLDPMIVGLRGLDRTARAFLLKFRSIQRNYRVLDGADPLAGLVIEDDLLRFECEQALRNLRLRLVRGFVLHGDDAARYGRFLGELVADLFVVLSETARVCGTTVPAARSDRAPVLAKVFAADAAVLGELLELKARGRTATTGSTLELHGRLYRLVDRAVGLLGAPA